jgi:carbonic anhydrase/acetyltransferase-like protein (isoleucine patch superfamily)
LAPRSNIQEQAVLHSDEGIPCTVGEGVTVGHHVMLHGCTIGNNSLIGMGATILNRAVIPENCVVGAVCAGYGGQDL